MKKVVVMGFVFMMCVAMVGCKKENSSKGSKQTGSGEAAAVADESGNYVVNGDFETEDLSAWTITNVEDVTEDLGWYDRETDATSGKGSLHFYSGGNVAFTVEQKLTGLPEGKYTLSCNIQGDGAVDPDIYLYAIVNGQTFKAETSLVGYTTWSTPVLDELNITDGNITLGIAVNNGPGGWGTIDDFSLIQQ